MIRRNTAVGGLPMRKKHGNCWKRSGAIGYKKSPATPISLEQQNAYLNQ